MKMAIERINKSVRRTTPPKRTIGQLQESYEAAVFVGDQETAAILKTMIQERGGAVAETPPADESEADKLARLIRAARRVNDTASVEILDGKLAALTAGGLTSEAPDEEENRDGVQTDAETEEPSGASDEVEEGPEEEADEEPLNSGDMTEAGLKMIRAEGLNVDDIPGRATDMKVGVPEIRAYLEALKDD